MLNCTAQLVRVYDKEEEEQGGRTVVAVAFFIL